MVIADRVAEVVPEAGAGVVDVVVGAMGEVDTADMAAEAAAGDRTCRKSGHSWSRLVGTIDK